MKAIALVSDIKSLICGGKISEQKIEERRYIDINSWDEPNNKFFKYIKRIFSDK